MTVDPITPPPELVQKKVCGYEIKPFADLRGVDLEGVDLEDANLTDDELKTLTWTY